MRVLISAYACEPEKGSEPAVGWNWVRQIARFHEVWVLTRANNRKALEKALASDPLPNVHWVYVDLPPWALFWKKGGRGLYLYYCTWQVGVYVAAKKLHRRVNFNLVHHVTFGASWFPTFLHFLPVPFVWGPVGAGLPCPRAFHREFSFRGKASEWARQVMLIVSRLDPVHRQIENRASLIVAISSATVDQLKPKNQQKTILFSQVGVDRDELALPFENSADSSNSFRLLSVGRLVYWKGFALGIEAFAIFNKQHPNSEYWIIGDGPEKARLTHIVSSLGLSSVVRFLGPLHRETYLKHLSQSSVLLFPSVHEPGAFVIVEAMAARRPVVCLDFGEPATIVTSDTGIKVPLSIPERVVIAISQAIALLASDPSLCERMGNAGHRRALETFAWDMKGIAMMEIYQRVMGGPAHSDRH